ncbi:alpha/beta fold hydrolase [Enteractinococcus fodinae]|uniref:Pimeloyl-ACP methyl ester carboxylesterase n=1 Tax=Enteractinococcus fodinae TaxID=684663 RepID=A0ABU2B3I8_9MICC|nr:alpha/beta fold hydrolase [Enteractinococcus fodinae]MDR7346974.1 pimeloyl-ACP methyl ester carboxylesterase [Enteractinococcus fodinae]
MANFLLLHGAASTGWLWHRVTPELHQAGHATVAPNLPCADATADLHTYLDVACTAAATFGDASLTVVAQSLAGLMVPALVARLPVDRIVLVAAMIPRPDETGMQWWQATGQQQAQRAYLESLGFSADDAQDPEVVFIHDFDEDLKAESIHHVPEQHPGPLQTPVEFESWPQVPTHVIAAEADRLFPLDFMRQQAMDRLGIEPDVIPGGHLAPLTQPTALGRLLLQYQS